MQTENISLYRRLHRMDLKQKPKSGKIIPHLLDSKLLSINEKRKKTETTSETPHHHAIQYNTIQCSLF